MSDWQWYVLLVAPGRELAIQSDLIEQGYHAFVPIRHSLRRPKKGHRRRNLVAHSQMPGYVLIGAEPDAWLTWKDVLNQPHVLGALGAGEPQPVYEKSLIPMLAGSHRPQAYVNWPRKKKRRNKGQRTATILNGPYRDKTVRIVEIAERDPEIYELIL